MKFAKELERDLVPEWRVKYFDYKQGKKRLKLIGRALRNVNQTPRLRRRGTNTFTPSPFDTAPKYSFLNRNHTGRNTSGDGGSGDLRAVAIRNDRASVKAKANGSRSSLSQEVARSPEEQPLKGSQDQEYPGLTRYGSIIGSPPDRPLRESGDARGRMPPALKLPGAALDSEGASPQPGPAAGANGKSKTVTLPPNAEDPVQVGKTRSHVGQSSTLPSRYKSIFSPKRINSTPGHDHSRPLLKRVFSLGGKGIPPADLGDVPLEAYRDLDIRQAEFFHFLDMELEKIESFYKQKEGEATERLNVLREQLHIMRDRRVEELIAIQTAKLRAKQAKKSPRKSPVRSILNGYISRSEDEGQDASSASNVLNVSWLKPIDSALEAVQAGRHGKATKAMHDLGTPTALRPQGFPDDRRDYSRRPDLPDVPYRSAIRKLKTALQEYYRGLELLKSYALLNRIAFRKINKKYDKTVNARPSGRYMSEKVNKAYFVQSDVLEGHIRAVEDLYARYFEKGNHKVAVGKLRVKVARAGDFTENSFRNGLLLGTGLVFGIQGLVYTTRLLFSGLGVRDGDDEEEDDDGGNLIVNTSYLLQIYAGYFLMNFLFLLFCLACRVWHKAKINYAFVFEYDTRHHLDWRQLSELPCFFLFLLGLFMWLNFSQFGGETIYLYYPILLIGISTIILFFPARVLYYRSRTWLIYSTWRLLLAGLYPVEFRDFYLGDMFCSLTYSMGNVALFFCLYTNEWYAPSQCNSSHSRLLGFFATLPGIWRTLQCIRRYYDTRNVFPHLVNCGKYMATILFYITLSIYRIQKNPENRAIFITFAILNSVYCSIWDVIMDWSLGNPYARNPYLRDTLGYKKVWVYYVALVLDPLLRFNWIFYAIWPIELQHSAILSFAVALSEICRRGIWTLFRVENEHCTNVGRFRASRDVPLPYDLPSSPELSQRTSAEQQQHPDDETPSPHTSLRRTPTAPVPEGLVHAETFSTVADLEIQRKHSTSRTRRRRATSFGGDDSSPITRGLSRVGTILRDAHAQDFERRRKPELGKGEIGKTEEEDSDDDDMCGEDSGNNSSAEDNEEIREVREERDIRNGGVENGQPGPSG
ncbi:EXS-domain-containing protein [Zopfia rhizophila CBS 207.26]|uniref:EXS-domain-containing protein n=1 Tax=Zopfia rhizophila CBS 207.26 TaxID=1314779 RepID=A0A6A6DLD9_9PEZI|nr:EXS-domain-containing protein [Zopfia rhizophila CBS 207.26]